MAIAIDGSTPARFTGTVANNVDITSASFTPPSGAVLVACVNGYADVDITISISDSTGLTWSQRIERGVASSGGSDGHSSIWTSSSTSNTSMTVSVRRTAGAPGNNTISAKVYVVTGVDAASPAGNNNTANSGINNWTATWYTSSANGSRGFGCATDMNNLGTPTSTDTGDGGTTAGAMSYLSVHKAANTATSGTAVTFNFNAGGTSGANWCAVAQEIKAGTVSDQNITGVGNIASGEGFGTATVMFPTQTVEPTGIASGEGFGTTVLAYVISPPGIGSAEAFGTPTVLPGDAFISPPGVASGEAFGTATVATSVTVQPTSIDSGEAFGVATITTGSVTIIPDSIASGEAFGTATVFQPAGGNNAGGSIYMEEWT